MTKSVLILLVALGAGCASPRAQPLADALEEGAPAARRARFSVAVAPLEVLPSAALRPADPDEHWSPVPADIPALRADLTRAVVASGAFEPERVRFLEALADRERVPPAEELGGPIAAASAPGPAAQGEGAAAGAPVFRVPPPVPADEIFSAAFAERSDLVLSFKVRKHAARYVGRNGWFIPNLFNFAGLVWTAWLVADERYSGEMEVEAALHATGSERELWKKVYSAAPVLDLDHFDRGWTLTGILTIPAWLSLDNYVKAGAVTVPHARNEIARQLREDLAKLAPSMSEEWAAQRLAVSVGVSRHRSIQDFHVAADDANAFAAMLRDPGRGGVPARNVVVLTDTQPTRERVLAELGERAQRCGPRDTLLLYFSGYGFAARGEVYLAPHDLDPSKPLESAISLADLAKALSAAGGSKVLVLDTSFTGRAQRTALRTLDRSQAAGIPEEEDPNAAADGARAALERFAKGGRTAILAASPGSAAAEMSPIREDKKGLLTARLLGAAGAPATDADKDGWLSVAEIYEAARREVARLSARAGLAQEPALLAGGLDPKRIRLVPVRPKETKP